MVEKFSGVMRRFLCYFSAFCMVSQQTAWAVSDVQINSGATVQEIDNTTVINHHTNAGSSVSYIDAERFNSSSEGLAFNNNAGTESINSNLPLLVTAVDANPHLKGGEASIIYTEVTSNKTSILNGAIEILGGNAEFILANPNGIQCKGCAFWRTPGYGNNSKQNISKAILGVGSLRQDDGAGPQSLSSVVSIDPNKVVLTVDRNVSGGKERSFLVIDNGGLDATYTDYIGLIGRIVKIRDSITAGGELDIVAGRGAYQIANGNFIKAADNDADGEVSLAIDASNFGAMQAGRIKIRATEEGVGVTTNGSLIASAGDVSISADGTIRFKNVTANQGKITITSSDTDFANSKAALILEGVLQAKEDIALNANSGFIQADASGGAGIHSTSGTVLLSKKLETDSDLSIKAAILDYRGDIISTASTADISIDAAFAGNVNNRIIRSLGNLFINTLTAGLTNNGSLIANKKLTIAGGGDLVNTRLIQSGDDLALNIAGHFTLDNLVNFVSGGKYIIGAGSFTNEQIFDLRGGSINVTGLLINNNTIKDSDLSVTAGTLNNNGSLLSTNNMALTANNSLLNNGTIDASNHLTIAGTGLFTYGANPAAIFKSGGTINITINNFINNRVLDLQGGSIDSVNVTNNSTLFNQDSLNISVSNTLTNNGLLFANNDLMLYVDTLLNQGGSIASLGGALTIAKDSGGGQSSLIRNQGGTIKAYSVSANILGEGILEEVLVADPQPIIDFYLQLLVAGVPIAPEEVLDAITDKNLAILSGQAPGSGGQGVVDIKAKRLENLGGSHLTGENILLTGGDILNRGSLIASNTNVTINADNVTNTYTDGTPGGIGGIYAILDTTMNLTGTLTNSSLVRGAKIEVNGSVSNVNDGVILPGVSVNELALLPYVFTPANNDGLFSAEGGQTGFLYELNPAYASADSSRFSKAFFGSIGVDLTTTTIVGDDHYIASLVNKGIHHLFGEYFITGHYSEVNELRQIYENTRLSMLEYGFGFGEAIPVLARSLIKKPILQFELQNIAGKDVYVPKIIFPNDDHFLADRFFASIEAQNALIFKGQDIYNSGQIKSKGSFTVHAVNMTNDVDTRNWYVDKAGQVRYRQGIIETPQDIQIALGGDYVSNGGILLAGNNVFVDAKGNIAFGTAKDNPAIGSIIAAGGHMFAEAGNDLTIEGSEVHLAGSAVLDAKRDVNIISKEKDGINYGSQVKLGGSLLINSEEVDEEGNVIEETNRDVNIIGSNVEVAGAVLINSDHAINIRGAKNTTYTTANVTSFEPLTSSAIAARSSTTGSGRITSGGPMIFNTEGHFFGSAGLKTDGDLYITADDITFGKELDSRWHNSNLLVSSLVGEGSINAGGQVFMKSDKDIHFLAADVTSGGNTVLLADNDITFDHIAVRNYSYTGGGNSFVIRDTTKNYGTNLNVGDSLIAKSGQDITISASNLKVANDSVFDTGRDFNMGKKNADGTIENVQDRDYYYSYYKKKGKLLKKSKVFISTYDRYTTVQPTLETGRDLYLNTLEVDPETAAISVPDNATLAGLDESAAEDLRRSRDINIIAGRITAGRHAYIEAGRQFNMIAGYNSNYERHERQKSGMLSSSQSIDIRQKITVVRPELNVGGNLLVKAYGGDIALESASLSAVGDIMLEARKKINITSAANKSFSESKSEKTRGFGFSSLPLGTGEINISEKYLLEHVSTEIKGDNITLLSGDDTVMLNAELEANNAIDIRVGLYRDEEGNIYTNDQANLVIGALEDVERNYQYSKKRSISLTSFLGGMLTGFSYSPGYNEKEQFTRTEDITQRGSNLSGDSSKLKAGQDIRIIASNVVSTHNTDLDAGANVEIVSAHDKQYSASYVKEMNSGLSLEGLSVFIGTETQQVNTSMNRTINSPSTVGSIEGDVNITAGNNYLQRASHIITPGGDVNIVAKDVNIESGVDSILFRETRKYKKDGTTVSITHPVIEAIQTAIRLQKAKEKTSSSRMQMLATAAQLSNMYDAASAIGGMMGGSGTGYGGIGIAANVGVSTSKSEFTQTTDMAASSSITSAGDINITALGNGKDSGITFEGSQADAGGNINLNAEGNIELLAAKNTSTLDSENSSQSGSVGAKLAFGGTQNGLSFNIGLSLGRGNTDGNDVSWTESVLIADNAVHINASQDVDIMGSIVKADQVTMMVGDDLNIVSLQDNSEFESEQKNASIGASVCVPPICYGTTVEVSGSYGQKEINSTYTSVREQAGIYAGDGGFQVTVEDETNLAGAVISSNDKAIEEEKNELTTGTLATRDISNYAEYDAEGFSVSGSASIGSNSSSKAPQGGDGAGSSAFSKLKDLMGKSPVTPSSYGQGSDSGEAGSVTRSGISDGSIKITDEQGQQGRTGQSSEETLASLNRDVSSEKDNSNALGQIFDHQKVVDEIDAQIMITQEFGQAANKQISSYTHKKLAEANAKKEQAAKETDPEKKQALLDEAKAIEDKWGKNGTGTAALNIIVATLAYGKSGLTSAVSKESLAWAANEMRENMIEDSKKFPGICDSYGNCLDNKSGISEGVDGDGFKLAGGRVSLDKICGGGKCEVDPNSPDGWKRRDDGTLIYNENLKDFLESPQGHNLRSVMGGFQGKEGLFSFFNYESGSSWDKMAEAYAGTHDTLNSYIFYDAQGNIKKGVEGTPKGDVGEFLNYTNVIVATPFALSELLPPEIWQAIAIPLQ